AAIAGHRYSLVKNLVLTLGELKVRDAIPHFARLATDRESPEIALSAIVSFGKVGRDPRLLEKLEPVYSRDLLEYQIFSGAVAQARLRSQWTLEDYLTKLFDAPAPDRSLPLELNAFGASDVRAGLGLFHEPKQYSRLLFALSRLDFPEAVGWYQELFDFERA